MRRLTMLRISPLIWISPLLVWPAWMFVTSMASLQLDPYPLTLTAAGTAALLIVAPVCAAGGAWEGGRLRRAGWFTLPHVRTPLTVAITALLPTLLVGSLITFGIIGIRLVIGGVLLPDIRMIITTLVILTTHTLLGFAIGVRMPVVVSVPLVFLVDFFALGLPLTLDPLWLRHLTGIWPSCCLIGADLAPAALLGALVFTGGLAVTAGLLLHPHLTAFRLALALLPAIIGAGAGVQFVRGFGPDPTIARDPALLVCSTGQPRVCVWPEHQPRLEEVAAIAASAGAAWQQAGIAVPDEFSEGQPGSPTVRGFGFSMRSDHYTILNALAYSLLPPWPECAFSGISPYLGAPAEGYVLAWLNTIAGMPPEQLAGRFSPDQLQVVATVRALPLERQQAWLERNLVALEQCNIPPQLEPAL